MAVKLFLIFCVAVSAANAYTVEPWHGVHGRCNDPALWCKSVENAKACGTKQARTILEKDAKKYPPSYPEMRSNIQVLEHCITEWGKPDQQKEASSGPRADAIKVTVYYESFCPASMEFINSQWYPTYKKLNGTGILLSELVPFGNAKMHKIADKYIFHCQHGRKECIGNLIASCAIKHLGKISEWAPFIYCLEFHRPSRYVAYECAKSLGIDYLPIDECANGVEGIQLEHEMALKTNALNPRHKFVPWIVVNGVHTEDIQDRVKHGMLEYVCQEYKGPKPAACKGV